MSARIKIMIACYVACVLAVAAQGQFTIGGHPAVLDSLTQTYLCSVPESAFGHDFTSIINFDDTTSIVEVNGKGVAKSGDKVTFDSIAGNRLYPVKFASDSDTITRYITFTYLPIVELNGSYAKTYRKGDIVFIKPDGNAQIMHARIRWRGATTNTGDKHKRNYHIKFIDEAGEKMDRRLFEGMRSDNNWLLDAGQIDLARIRNHVGMQLWQDFATKPYYADLEPRVRTGVSSEMVELFLNGQYMGFYSMGEAIDRKQLRLRKYDEATLDVYGQLWKTTQWTSLVYMSQVTEDYPPFSDTWNGYEVKYPELDDVAPTDWTVMHDAIDFVANSSDDDFVRHVDEYFDLPVLRDFQVLIHTLLGVDNSGKNVYWACYDRTASTMLTITPWDLDATVGQYWNNSSNPNPAVLPEREFTTSQRLFRRLNSLNPNGYKIAVIKRYHQLRQDILSEDNLIARYVGCIEYLQRCGATAREEARWSGDTDIQGATLDFEHEKAYIADWIHRRLLYLDENTFKYEPIIGDVNSDGTVNGIDLNLLINQVLGKGESIPEADLNSDGTVNGIDVNLLINILLGLE